MSIFTSILSFFASLTRPKPSRDWFFALVIIFATFLGLVSYAGYLFISINSGSAFANGEQSPAPTISLTRAEVRTILETYQKRSVNYTAHNLPSPVVVDPGK